MPLQNASSVLIDFNVENRTILEFRAWILTFSGTDDSRTNARFRISYMKRPELQRESRHRLSV
jgi:hypothetical protein